MSTFEGKADMTIRGGMSAFAAAIGGKADIAFCGAHVCYGPIVLKKSAVATHDVH